MKSINFRACLLFTIFLTISLMLILVINKEASHVDTHWVDNGEFLEGEIENKDLTKSPQYTSMSNNIDIYAEQSKTDDLVIEVEVSNTHEEYAFDAMFDAEQLVINKTRELLIEKFGREEGEFRFQLTQMIAGDLEGWKELKQLAEARATITGTDYKEILFRTAFGKNVLSEDDISEFSQSGVNITSDDVGVLAMSGDKAAFIDFAKHGVSIDFGSDPSAKINLVKQFVNGVKYSPIMANSAFRDIDVKRLELAMQNLMNLGPSVDLSNTDVDLLGAALQDLSYSSSSLFQKTLVIADVLIENGYSVGDEHVDLIRNMKDKHRQAQLSYKFGLDI